MARHILKPSQDLQDRKIMHPEREWITGMAFALIIVTASASWSVYAYWTNKTIEVVSDKTTSEEDVVYRESVVKDALIRFEKRNKEREALIAGFTVQAPPPAPATEVATSTVEGQGTSTLEVVPEIQPTGL